MRSIMHAALYQFCSADSTRSLNGAALSEFECALPTRRIRRSTRRGFPLEAVMRREGIEPVQPAEARAREHLGIRPVSGGIGHRCGMDMSLGRPVQRSEIESRAADRAEAALHPGAAFIMVDRTAPGELRGEAAEKGGDGRAGRAPAIRAITDEVARGVAGIGPAHRAAHAVTGKRVSCHGRSSTVGRAV